MSDTMEEGVITTWLKKEGDTVKAGDILAEVETDKATMELEAYEDGTLLHIGVKATEAVPINAVIAVIGEPGEDISALLTQTQPAEQAVQEEVSAQTSLAHKATPNDSGKPAVPPPSPPPTKIFSSPLAKKMASEKGYDLANIKGTGEGGRIIKRDIEHIGTIQLPVQKAPSISLSAIVGEERYEDIPVSPMRKTIAKRVTASKLNAPHFYLTVNVDMDQVVAARSSINAYTNVKISFNDIIIKVAAIAIRQHPAINTAWLEDKIRYYQHIHIGIAVAVAEGLVVPVLRFADNKSLTSIANEVKILRQKAQDNQLSSKEMENSTFTISNLGMLGIESFTAIVNPPAACILAIGEVKQVPVVKDGTVVPGHTMKVTLSGDHRVVDGAVGAAFLQTFKELLEDPRRMLVY